MRRKVMKNQKKELNIEESFKSLDKIIEQMDDDKCSIEKGLELYESGVKMINELSKKIDKIDRDLKVLNK